jgi:glucoside 3-dehydrogenase (cytochrome c) hitch-hiker subunit
VSSSVPESSNSGKLNRRELLLGVVFLVGGAAALSRFARHSGGNAVSGPVFSPDQLALLEQIAGTMIPASDTPGAIEAGVPAFMQQMLADWGSPKTRREVVDVLERVEKLAWNRYGAAFLTLPAERRLEVLREVDAQGVTSQDPAYSKFKWLVLAGYYQSEIGATQELRYELVPGAWRACLPLAEVGRASAV